LGERGLSRQSKLAGDVLDYHTSPQDALRVAREAGAKTLVFTHLVPPVSGMVAGRIFLGELGDKHGVDVMLGEDGLHFRLDPDGDTESDTLE